MANMEKTMVNMEKDDKTSRKNFVTRGLGWAALIIAANIPFVLRAKPPDQTEDNLKGKPQDGTQGELHEKLQGKARMVKMLTQDGVLVEVDERRLPSNRKKISNAELKKWVRKK